MRFKIDENLPVQLEELLRAAGHQASTVMEQGMLGAIDSDLISHCVAEDSALVTLDLGFADIRTYPPQDFGGLIVLRLTRQDRDALVAGFRHVIPLLESETLDRHLWIVEETRVRIRGEDE